MYKKDAANQKGGGKSETEEEIEKQHIYKKVYSSNGSKNGTKNLELVIGFDGSTIHLNTENKYFNQMVNNNQKFIVDKHTKSIDKAWSTSYVSVKSNHTCSIREGLSEKEIENSGKDLFSTIYKIYSKFKTNDQNACESYVFVDPFKEYFIQVDSYFNVEVEYKFTLVDFRLIILCILALVLFFEAERISKNVTFYYASGISIGLLGSCLILLVLLMRFIPKKTAAAFTLLTGSSIFLFSVQWIYFNIKTVLETFQMYIIAYFCLSVLISFLFLYYRGPITNPKTFKIIEVFLKAISTILFYMGIAIKEIFASLVIAIILGYIIMYCSTKLKSLSVLRNIRYRLFPPVRKLLTEEEYIREGHDYTIKALKELGEYCNSPQCDSWKTISRLKSPERFAKFVMNEEPHINDAEINEHERFSIESDLIDEDL